LRQVCEQVVERKFGEETKSKDKRKASTQRPQSKNTEGTKKNEVTLAGLKPGAHKSKREDHA
jgi:hypothetical protein